MLLLAAALLAADLSAASVTPPAQPAPAVKPVKQEKICRVDENESSSRLRKRICLTQTEWDQKAAGKTANDLKNIGGR